LKRFALDEGVEKFPQAEVLFSGSLHDGLDKFFVAEAARATKAVLNQSTSEATRKGVGPARDNVPHFLKIAESRPAMKAPSGIDDPVLLCVWQRFTIVVTGLK